MTAPVGYSGKPLAAKLGVRDGSRVLLVGAPAGFDLAAPAGAVVRSRPGPASPYDVVLAFCPDRAALRRRFAAQLPRLTTAGALWVAWPKRSSGVAPTWTRTWSARTGWRSGWWTSRWPRWTRPGPG